MHFRFSSFSILYTYTDKHVPPHTHIQSAGGTYDPFISDHRATTLHSVGVVRLGISCEVGNQGVRLGIATRLGTRPRRPRMGTGLKGVSHENGWTFDLINR